MFCHKCGAQIAERAAFCHKCGTKVVYEDASQRPPNTSTETTDFTAVKSTEPAQQTPPVSIQADTPINVSSAGKTAFKVFVDSFIQANTQYQTAEDLLNGKVSILFVWVCLGVAAILGVVTFNPVVMLFVLFLGYVAANVISGVKRGQYAFRYSGKIDTNIDKDHLIQYLNRCLNMEYPYFHEWGVIKRVGSGLQGKALTAISTSVAESLKEITLCAAFGEDQRCLTTITIHPDTTNANTNLLKYSFGAELRLMDAEPFSAQNTGFDFTFSRYKCLVKVAPILQAAMEYYLKNYKQD